MRNNIFIGVITFIVTIFFGFAPNKTSTSNEGKQFIDVNSEVNELTDSFDKLFYKSVYSIDEVRPYSIIQIDKISKLYKNQWISPELIVNKLTEADKELLKSKIVEYIKSYESVSVQRSLLDRIKWWCIAWQQFDFIKEKFCLTHDIILTAIIKVASTNHIIAQFYDYQTFSEGKLSEAEQERAYYASLNFISSLGFEEQMRYYSSIYNQLALIAKN